MIQNPAKLVDGYYIGLMSGTSMDGIDAALVSFQAGEMELIASSLSPWSDAMKSRLRAISHAGENEISRLGPLDAELGDLFAQVVIDLLNGSAIDPSSVVAIGCHGQTIRHHPSGPFPYTLQIGDPNRIALHTGITTVADLRRRDMAAGGEGAPLVPAFHADFFAAPDEYRAVLNIGGIANLTLIPPTNATGEAGVVRGFDTGPGNTLLDYWIMHHLHRPCDEGGEWAEGGQLDHRLLQQLLDDSYFSRPPPKSTGPEYFSPQWLKERLPAPGSCDPRDIQATLTALTSDSIIHALKEHAADCQRLIVCGGGVHNRSLMSRLAAGLEGCELHTTADYHISPDLVEAIAFAWLARRTISRATGNLPAVTGAEKAVILGGVYYP